MPVIREKIKTLLGEIEALEKSSARDNTKICLVIVTKNVTEERILEAYEAGVRDFGENRVQELLQKKPNLPKDIRWHFIGHLQSNKVKDLAGQVVLIHSLDSVHLAKELEKVSGKMNIITEVLIQVNTSREFTKHGFKLDEIEDVVGEMTRFAHLRIRGLMTIGPLTDRTEEIRNSFILLRNLQKKMRASYPDLDWSELSMGMSDDFPLAIQEGSTILRVGRAVFGERK